MTDIPALLKEAEEALEPFGLAADSMVIFDSREHEHVMLTARGLGYDMEAADFRRARKAATALREAGAGETGSELGTFEIGKPVRLGDCPPGLFLDDYGQLNVKSEYHTAKGAIEAYIGTSGEFFWGDHPQTIENQADQIVRPVTQTPVSLSREPVAPSPTQGDEGALRERLSNAITRERLNLPMKASELTIGVLEDALAALTRPTPPDRGDEAAVTAFGQYWQRNWGWMERHALGSNPPKYQDVFVAGFLAARSPSTGEEG